VDPLRGARRRRLSLGRERQDAVQRQLRAAQQLGLDRGHHRDERVDERGVEVAPALELELAQGIRERPLGLVAARGEQRVEDVADGADARGQRDLLAAEARGVARPVPALVVRQRDRLGELQQW